MREPKVEGELATLLSDYHHWGGVLQVVPLTFEPRGSGARQPMDRHRMAAIATLRAIENEYKARLVRLHQPARGFITSKDQARGERISLEAFLGPFYDAERQCLILRGAGGRYHRAIEPDTFTPDLLAADAYDRSGLAYAYSEPPHGLRAPGGSAQVDAVFHRMAQLAFGGIRPDLVIMAWSTDWSSYFDDGREWWGTFFWTVENPSTGQIAGLAASSTD